MKLHWSPRSPFVRKIMIAANEHGLADRLKLTRTVVHPEAVNETLLADNPLSKLPTLVLDDGTALYDSRVICEYLDTISSGTTLFPSASGHRFAALRNQALGDGMLDILLTLLVERVKPEVQQSPKLIAAINRKIEASLDRLETDIGTIAARPFDIGHLTVGAALLYLDFRFQADNWHVGRPNLSVWYKTFCRRPSVVASPVNDD
jgi:glutathione S-transferase